jgi:mono/diheme cytochrome c family protein
VSVWVWFVIAGGLLLVFRTVAKTTPEHADSARRMGTTVVLTALGLAIAHAVYLRDSSTVRLQHVAAARAAAVRAEAQTARRHRRLLRDEQIARRTPLIRERLLVAAYNGETGMYEGRAVFVSRCGECHGEDGGGVPDQTRSPSIIGLGGREREALVPYLLHDHPLPYAGVISEAELEQVASFLWNGLLDRLPE